MERKVLEANPESRPPYNVHMGTRLRWLVVVLLLAGAGILLRMTVLAPEPVEVRVAMVDRGTVEETVANTRAGTVRARLRARLSPQTGGLVVRLPFREGARVEEGDLLLELDSRVQRAQLEVARREVETALRRAEDACLAADLAASELVRLEELAEAGVASDQQLDRARTEHERTRAACEASRAAVEQARAAVHAARVQVELCTLRAPFAGVVAELSTEIGEWITPSPPGVPLPPVIDLLAPESLFVSAPIDEVDSERVRVGQEVRITVDSRPGEHFTGGVVRVAPYVEDVLEQNRTVEVEVEFAEPGRWEGLLPGTSADVEIVLERREGVLRVPAAAVAEGGKVLVLEDGRLAERTVRTGLSNWEYMEVLEGLAEGERVVTLRDSTDIVPGARAVARP